MIRMIKSFLEKRKVLAEIQDTTAHYEEVIHDPLNGCPGDFIEEGNRKIRSLIHRAYALDIPMNKVEDAIDKGYARIDDARI